MDDFTRGYLSLPHIEKQANPAAAAGASAALAPLLNAGGSVIKGTAGIVKELISKMAPVAYLGPAAGGALAGYMHSNITSPDDSDAEAIQARIGAMEQKRLLQLLERQRDEQRRKEQRAADTPSARAIRL